VHFLAGAEELASPLFIGIWRGRPGFGRSLRAQGTGSRKSSDKGQKEKQKADAHGGGC
jgi:hypothetical protein